MKKLSAAETTKRIEAVHGSRYALVTETYIHLKAKAWFYDTKKEEWFYTVPDYLAHGCDNPSDRAAKIGKANTPMLREMGRKRTKYVGSSGEVLAHLCNQYEISQSTYQKLAKQTSVDFAIKALLSKVKDGKYTKYQSNLEVFAIDLLKDQIPGVQKWNKKPTEDGTITHHPDLRLEHNGRTLYVDLHGLYFHSDYQVDQEYHRRRSQDFQKIKIPYIQFFADEVYGKPEIVKSMILSKLGMSVNQYAARKLELKPVGTENARVFFGQNHLMGYKVGTTVGLFEEDKLITALTYKRHQDRVEIERFATLLNSSCAGGFGKLVSYLKQFNLPISSFCDLRYSDGHSYVAVGFTQVGETLGWNWTNGAKRYNRLSCKAGNGKSEKENAKERGWFKIYDAGQRKYVLHPSTTAVNTPRPTEHH